MLYEVLIPTYNKSDSEIISIVKNINTKCSVLIVNQINMDNETIKVINGNRVRIINVSNAGVSNNRNNLLKFASGDICICVDDDCPLVDDYLQIVDDAYKKYNNAEAIYFNGVWSTHNNKLLFKGKSKRIKRFCDISFGGGPGFTFKRSIVKKYSLSYDTSVGYPNYICAGEDSLFYHSLVKNKVSFYRDSRVLFNVAIDETNSSYFKGINEQYVVTRGYITYKIHPILFFVYKIRHIIRFRKQNKKNSIHIMLRWMDKGKKIAKKK